MHFVAPKFSGGTCQSTLGIAQTVRRLRGQGSKQRSGIWVEERVLDGRWTVAADWLAAADHGHAHTKRTDRRISFKTQYMAL